MAAKTTSAKNSPDVKRPTKKQAAQRGGAASSESNGSGKGVTSERYASYTVPGLTTDEGHDVSSKLQDRLIGLLDLSLTLKHIHWNVVGPHFIAVHQMLDPQHDGVQTMIDDLAERIAALGGVPSGLPGRIVDDRTWTDYRLDRADAMAHLGALDLVYTGVIEDHRATIEEVGDVDAMSEDLLVGQTRELEKYHWFVRSHLADYAGGLANAGADSEFDAARAVLTKRRTRSRSPKR